ncbi:MAG: hypothetical protein EAY81_05890 [Bacteroidetes bacterium]|nr:MAG: hypothetical protein EAY81_05890 [Bacteroidota bacterium]
MATELNKTKEIKARLNAIEQVRPMSTQSDAAMIHAVNQQMENVRREYQIKERESQLSASRVVLTA